MTTVLLRIQDRDRQRQIAEALAQSNFEVLLDAVENATHEAPEIIVSDQTVEADPRRRPAIAAIGWQGPADAMLAEDATAREIRLACSLLTEIVRLQKESRDSLRERADWQHRANSDPVTGLANRRAWDEEAPRMFARAAAEGRSLCLAILDLDRFKKVNDRYGHAVGDEVLKDAARAIAASVRASDFLARIGGDEFTLLLCDADAVAAAGVVERIRRAVANKCSHAAGPAVSISVGYSSLREGDRLEDLFERSDAALLQAKQEGRDRTVEG